MIGAQSQQTAQQQQFTEQQAIDDWLVNSLEDCISVLEGIGPMCSDIDEMIEMLKLALKVPGQRELIKAHMTPRRMMKR